MHKYVLFTFWVYLHGWSCVAFTAAINHLFVFLTWKNLWVALCGCCAPFWATLLHLRAHQSSAFCHAGSLSCAVKGLLASQLHTQLWGPPCPPTVMHFHCWSVLSETVCVIFFSSALQFVILVVDSTDRERLAISKEELYRMLAHEVIS